MKTMKALFAASLIAGATIAQAATESLCSATANNGATGSIGTSLPGGSYGFCNTLNKNVTFTDTWDFSLAASSTGDVSITSRIVPDSTVNYGKNWSISSLTVALWDSALSTMLGSCTIASGDTCSTAPIALAADPTAYKIRVTGTVTGNQGGQYGSTLTVAPVPLPPAAILFGSVLFGLAVVGRRRLAGGAQAV